MAVGLRPPSMIARLHAKLVTSDARETRRTGPVTLGARIDIPQDALAALCTRWQISELALFGSVLRADYGPESDIDLLVRFRPEARRGTLSLISPRWSTNWASPSAARQTSSNGARSSAAATTSVGAPSSVRPRRSMPPAVQRVRLPTLRRARSGVRCCTCWRRKPFRRVPDKDRDDARYEPGGHQGSIRTPLCACVRRASSGGPSPPSRTSRCSQSNRVPTPHRQPRTPARPPP